MPKKTANANTASRARRSVIRRKNRQGKRRQAGSRAKTKAPAVIANSLFALTLKPKPALDVIPVLEGERSRINYGMTPEDYELMYEHLLAAFQNAYHLKTGERTWTDFHAAGMGLSESLACVVSGFKKNILPEGFDFNIERDYGGNYYFVIGKAMGFPGYWHCFEVAPVLLTLSKSDKKLHDLFVVFLASFMKKTGIHGWWNGGMGYAEYQIQERINNWDDNYFGDSSGDLETAEK